MSFSRVAFSSLPVLQLKVNLLYISEMSEVNLLYISETSEADEAVKQGPSVSMSGSLSVSGLCLTRQPAGRPVGLGGFGS